MKDLWSPILAIIGVVVGASAQFLFARLSENRKSFDKLRTDSYVDFIKAVTGVATAQRFKDKAEELRADSLMQDAKVRIAIYGDPIIAREVGAFFERYGDLSKEEDRRAFVRLMCNIRRSVTGDATASDRVAISQILFSEVVPE